MSVIPTSVWTPWRTRAIVDTNPLPFPAIRANDFARVVTAHLSSLILNSGATSEFLAVVPGWTYTTSYARGEASPGTVSAPARTYYTRGSDNKALWLKIANTWASVGGQTMLTKAKLYYSSDNQASYAPLLDEDGNYVLTPTYYPGVKASAWLLGVTIPNTGDTVVVGAKTYTFKTTLTPTEGQVLINGTLDAALLNLTRAINHTGTPDTDYKCAAANTTVSAGPVGFEALTPTAHAVTLTALTVGTAGNAYALTPGGVRLTTALPWQGGINATADLMTTSWGNA